jgi:hypothetical protein
MLTFLESIWHGILDVPYLVIGFFVTAINNMIISLAFLAGLIVAALPSFPAAPTPPGGVIGGILWFFPLGTLLAVFTVFVGLWVAFLGFKAGLKWVRLL